MKPVTSHSYAIIKRAGTWSIVTGALELIAGLMALNLLTAKHTTSTTLLAVNGSLLLLTGIATVVAGWQLRRTASTGLTPNRRAFYIVASITSANTIIPIILGNPIGFIFLIPGLPLYQADKAFRQLQITPPR